MANNISDYLESKVLNFLFRTDSTFTKPGTIYIALCPTTPTDASTGTTIVEPVGNGYTRIALNPSDANWTAVAAAGETHNASVIQFPTCTTSAWGQINGFAVCDAATLGNMLFWGALGTAKPVNVGDSAKFDTAALSITLD
jgi:hypothetical protein